MNLDSGALFVFLRVMLGFSKYRTVSLDLCGKRLLAADIYSFC